ncbi:MAG: LPS export ABC transporter permease LptF [Alphaproteobacteria bacterium]|nr:LPS export ABC transporter permease LptF [Alphaproteobacteria bacterium]
MDQLTKYIVKQIAGVTVFVTVILCLAIWLTQSLRLVDLIVNRGLPLTTFAFMASLLIPRFLAIVLPIAVFSATLYTYNRLITDSELVVMRAAGLSASVLAKPGLIVAAGVTIVIALLQLYLLPLSYREFKDLQYTIRHNFGSILLQEGSFNTLSNGITVFIRERGSKGELKGIFVHDNRNPSQPVTMMAESGAIVRSDTGPRVILVNGNRQQVDRDGGKLSLLYFDKYTVEINVDSADVAARRREPRERYLHELLNPQDLDGDIHYGKKLAAEGHARLSSLFLPFNYCLIAMAFMLTGAFDRRGQSKALYTAIAVMASIVISHVGAQNMAAHRPAMNIAMYFAAIIPLMAGYYHLVSTRRRRNIPKGPNAALPAT